MQNQTTGQLHTKLTNNQTQQLNTANPGNGGGNVNQQPLTTNQQPQVLSSSLPKYPFQNQNLVTQSNQGASSITQSHLNINKVCKICKLGINIVMSVLFCFFLEPKKL